MTISRRGLLSVALLFVLAGAPAAQSVSWVGTWATAAVARPVAPAQAPPPGGQPPVHVNNQTLRQIVHISVGGTSLRVVFSNAFGTAPLTIGAAHVALRVKDAAIAAGSGRPLTFSGRPGNHAGAPDLPVAATTAAWFFLGRVEVVPSGPAGAVVLFGDSLTDGTRSTPNGNHRWPDYLARRLLAQPNVRLGVLNAGIAGNRLMTDGAGVNALARFDRDVIAQNGVTHVIVFEGINDLGQARENLPSVEDLIAAHQQLIARARAKGLRIYGATMLPFEGTNLGGVVSEYYTPEKDARRRAFNEWLRTSRAYDAVIDFEAAVRDPANPSRLSPKYKDADNLHLNDAGYEALANAVDLALLRRN